MKLYDGLRLIVLPGADAVLIHSKKSNPSDIEAFMKEWGSRHPVIIVPTKYYSTPTNRFREMGISMVIWANHNIRSAASAMQKTCQTIFKEQSLIHVEDSIASVSEIFRLQNADELKEAEQKYLPAAGKTCSAIILAASQGNLGELTRDIPKTLLTVNGKPLLHTQVDELNQAGIKEIAVVRGFAKDKIQLNNIQTIDNEIYAETKELYSLFLSKDSIQGHTIISFGDIIFRRFILNDLLSDINDITIVVDADFEYSEDGFKDFVKASLPCSKKFMKPQPICLKCQERCRKMKFQENLSVFGR
jgi:phosphoenolpyruvate phosphomutase